MLLRCTQHSRQNSKMHTYMRKATILCFKAPKPSLLDIMLNWICSFVATVSHFILWTCLCMFYMYFKSFFIHEQLLRAANNFPKKFKYVFLYYYLMGIEIHIMHTTTSRQLRRLHASTWKHKKNTPYNIAIMDVFQVMHYVFIIFFIFVFSVEL